jgi:hypothetical protein
LVTFIDFGSAGGSEFLNKSYVGRGHLYAGHLHAPFPQLGIVLPRRHTFANQKLVLQAATVKLFVTFFTNSAEASGQICRDDPKSGCSGSSFDIRRGAREPPVAGAV